VTCMTSQGSSLIGMAKWVFLSHRHHADINEH
jgi:hypothetical protein